MSTSRKIISTQSSVQQTRSETSDLIARIATGDEAAFQLFHEATNGLLFGLLLQILGHARTSERALSELYCEIKQNAARFSRQNQGPLTWLILIAHRRTVECLCSSRSARAEIQSINITQQRRQIRAAIESIPTSQRRMIELAFFSGMSNLEIAMELGESAKTVEDGLRDGMSQLVIIFRSVYDSSAPQSELAGETPELDSVLATVAG